MKSAYSTFRTQGFQAALTQNSVLFNTKGVLGLESKPAVNSSVQQQATASLDDSLPTQTSSSTVQGDDIPSQPVSSGDVQIPSPEEPVKNSLANALFKKLEALRETNDPDQLVKALKDFVDNKQFSKINKQFSELLKQRQFQIQQMAYDPKFISGNRQTKIKMFTENLGPGLGKLFQFLYSDSSLNLSDETRAFLGEFVSGNTPTRNIPTAQKTADRLFGANTYKVIGLGVNKDEPLGVGTIKEVFEAIDPQGNHRAFALIKKGITEEKLKADEEFILTLIEAFSINPTKKELKKQFIQNLFEGFEEELDLSNEVIAAQNLPSSVKPIQYGFDTDTGKIVGVIYEKAEGISIKKLIDLLKIRQEDNGKYLEEVEKLISQDSSLTWLRAPEEWMNKISSEYMRWFGKTEPKILKR